MSHDGTLRLATSGGPDQGGPSTPGAPSVSRSSRRAFLTGRTPRRSDPDVIGSHDEGLLRLRRRAMACSFELLLHTRDRSRLAAAHAGLALVDEVEAQLSVYRDDSEVAHLNRTAHERPVPLDAGLYELIRLARALGHETAGAYDITTGALIRCWGFFERQPRVPCAGALAAARASSGWSAVDLDEDARTIRFRVPGIELNFGSIGKGHALDRIAARLRDAGLTDFLLHAGQSSVVASGHGDEGEGWLVALRDPRSGGRLGTLRLRDEALSTSGIGEQGFEVDGQRLGHVLDPRTGWPSRECLQSSVVSDGGAVAEALSTAFFVMDEIAVRTCCDGRPEVKRVTLRTADGAPIVAGLVLGPPESA
jgi:thiamine biosynthesis lipoprotein